MFSHSRGIENGTFYLLYLSLNNNEFLQDDLFLFISNNTIIHFFKIYFMQNYLTLLSSKKIHLSIII